MVSIAVGAVRQKKNPSMPNGQADIAKYKSMNPVIDLCNTEQLLKALQSPAAQLPHVLCILGRYTLSVVRNNLR